MLIKNATTCIPADTKKLVPSYKFNVAGYSLLKINAANSAERLSVLATNPNNFP